MASRMKIIVVSRRIFHPLHIFTHGNIGEIPHLLVFGTGIQRIRRMGHQSPKVMFAQHFPQRLRVLLVNGFRLPSPGISCKKGKGIRSDFQRVLSHMRIAFCGR